MTTYDVTLHLNEVPLEDAEAAIKSVNRITHKDRGEFHLEQFEQRGGITNLIVRPALLVADSCDDIDHWLENVNRAVLRVCHRQLDGYWFQSGDDAPDRMSRFNGMSVESLESSWVFELPMEVGRALRDFAFTFEHDKNFSLSYLAGALAAYRDRLMKHVKSHREIGCKYKRKRLYEVVFLDDAGRDMSPFDLKLIATKAAHGGFETVLDEPRRVQFIVEREA